jgi:hypothetical protein
MSDDAGPRDSRHQLPVLLGVVGAVLGFVGAVLLALPSNPVDPVTSALTALFVFGPIGAVVGAFLGAKLGTLLRPTKAPAVESPAATAQTGVPGIKAVPQTSTGTEVVGATGRNAFKALAITFGSAAVLIGGYVFIDYHFFATPWLRPVFTVVQFEVRLPAGAAMPAGEVKADLQTSVNTMPADMKPALYRREGDRPVIVGEVDLAYRSSSRQIEVTIPGRAASTYQLKLKSSPPHDPQLGAWEKHPDGSEIRYRVKWAGKS